MNFAIAQALFYSFSEYSENIAESCFLPNDSRHNGWLEAESFLQNLQTAYWQTQLFFTQINEPFKYFFRESYLEQLVVNI